jgi:hypothetical protein
MKKNLQSIAMLIFTIVAVFTFYQDVLAQTQRNPVLEYCTGTWCVNCPSGHQIINNTILPNIPNAIIIGYHGPANGTDPFSFFPGNSIINTLLSQGGTTYYPTGSIDRISGIQSRGSWYSFMNNRNSVPATVAIELDKSFNKTTREFNASIDFTALTNLNGQYNFNVILLESGMVWAQTGGTSNYVHRHVVRSMMNGALGEEVINGTWNQNDVITKTIDYTVPVPGGPGPDIIWDSCDVVVMVYKVGTPLASNAEIQQAIQTILVSPDYVVNIASTSEDLIIEKNGLADFTTVVRNDGLLDDTYYVDVNMNAPTGWTAEFTTPNGTFPVGQRDSVDVMANDSLTVDVSVSPNVLNGFGEITVQFTSKNDPNIYATATLRVVTTTGVPGLIVDASGEGYADLVFDAIDQEFDYPLGIVSREALIPSVDYTDFSFIAWSTGNVYPVFVQDEVDGLTAFLDNGGSLLINGQNIGFDIFDGTGQSQFAQSFYNNYLHADYVSDWGLSYFFNGLAGDPIGDQLSVPLNSIYDRSPDEFIPFDASAQSIFKFGTLTKYNSVRADDGVNRVVYIGFGLEQIDASATRDTIAARSVRWLMDGIVLNTPKEDEIVATSFELSQNYPNPFNPSTAINYSIADESNVNVKIYDIMGREVANLVNERQPAGSYHVEFDASSLASGTYFYKLTAGEFVSVKKMTLLK